MNEASTIITFIEGLNLNDSTVVTIGIVIAILLYRYRSNIKSIVNTYLIGWFTTNKNVSKLIDDNASQRPEEKTDATIVLVETMSRLASEVSDMTKQQMGLASDIKTIAHNQDELKEHIVDLQHKFENINKELEERFKEISDSYDFLLLADKEEKKAFIVREYNYFYIDKECIDIHSLEVIERIYEIYLKEGGDTYVATLMTHLRSLNTVKHVNVKEPAKLD